MFLYNVTRYIFFFLLQERQTGYWMGVREADATWIQLNEFQFYFSFHMAVWPIRSNHKFWINESKNSDIHGNCVRSSFIKFEAVYLKALEQ